MNEPILNPQHQPRRVLVTGGAGFLGINLVRFLLTRGVEVSSLDIAPFDYPDAKEQITVTQGDVRNVDAIKRALENCDAVVHTAAALPLYSPDDIYTTDVVGTRNVLEDKRD